MTKKDFHFLIIIIFFISLILYSTQIYISYKKASSRKKAETYKVLSYINSNNLFTNYNNQEISTKNIEHAPTIFFQKNINPNDEIIISILRKLKNKFGNKLLIIEKLKTKNQKSEFLSFYDDTTGIEDFLKIKKDNILILFANSEPLFFNKNQYYEITNYIASAIESRASAKNINTITLSEKISTYINSPSYILYETNNSYFKNKKAKKPILFIANSGNNNILISLANGEIIEQIGSGSYGSKNGKFINAKLNMPKGLLYNKKDNLLYIADSGNHMIKVADLQNKTISNFIGSGKIGQKINKEENKKEIDLFFPHYLSFYQDNKYIIFSNSGTNQLLKYDIKSQKISPFLTDKEAKKIEQPTKIYNIDENLYILDQMQHIKLIDKNLKVKTIFSAPKKLYQISDFILQENAIFLSDIRKKAILRYDISDKNSTSREITLYKKLGSKPNDIVSILNKIYISSKEIFYFDRMDKDKKLEKYKITPPNYNFEKLSIISDELRFPKKLNDININKSQIKIISGKECKIENNSLTFLNFFKYNENSSSVEIIKQKKFFSNEKLNLILLPQMNQDSLYLIQGSFYCCNDNRNQCKIKKISKFFQASDNGKTLHQFIL